MDEPMYFKCFICNHENVLLSEGTSVTDNNIILKSGARLPEVVTQILGYEIQLMSNSLICLKCRQTCEEYDEINNRLSNIKTQLAGRFRESVSSVSSNLKQIQEETKGPSTRAKPLKSIVLTKSKLQPLPPNFMLNDKMSIVQNINNACKSSPVPQMLQVFKTQSQYISPGTSLIKSAQTDTVSQSDGFIKIEANSSLLPDTLLINPTASSSDTSLQACHTSTLSELTSQPSMKIENALIQPIGANMDTGHPSSENNMADAASSSTQSELDENYLIGEVEILEDDDADYDADTILMDENGSIIEVLHGDQRELLSQVDEISVVLPEGSSEYLQHIKTDTQTEDPLGVGNFSVKNIKEEQADELKPISDPEARTIIERVGTSYKCLICCHDLKKANSGVEGTSGDNTFDTPARIMTHMKRKHKLRLYVCHVCGDSYRRKSDFDLHFEEHISPILGEIDNTGTELKKKEKPYECSVCHNTYLCKSTLREHEQSHAGCRAHTCKVCNKSYANKYTYSAHLKTHSDRKRPFRCSDCSKTFYTLTYLMAHEKTHNPDKQVKCDLCEKSFKDRHNMEKHKRIHLGDRPFVCGICNKTFVRKCEVEDHVRTHTGERPFQCDICDKAFSQKANLMSHKRHTHTEERRYQCQHCEKKFKRKRLLVYHIQSAHTGERPFKCDVCPSTFIYPEHFKKHRRLHSGEKPYKCEVCGRAFNSRDNRNMHRYTHSEKKQFECLICGAGFMRRPQLMAHMNSQGHLVDMIVVNQAQVSVQAGAVSDAQLQEAEESIRLPLGAAQETEEAGTEQTESGAEQLFEDDDLIDIHDSEPDTGNTNSTDAGEAEEMPSDLLNSQVMRKLLAQGAKEVVTTDEQGNVVRLVRVQLDDGKTGWLSLHKLNADLLQQVAPQ